MSIRPGRRLTALLVVGLTCALAISGCDSSTKSAKSKKAAANCIRTLDADGKLTSKCLPVAAQKQRVDLGTPTFSNPTSVTNPLHPTSKVTQVIYGGTVKGKPFRTEFTLLPDIKTITVNGKRYKTITMQYFAYLDGRIEEVALDWFAQSDDGSVWYFGEDVFNYEEGSVANRDGTWLAGKNGAPIAMIMPGNPKPGDVYRVENLPEIVFEEVMVKSINQTIVGPSGSVGGVMIVDQLHMEGHRSDKIFVPGYGEYSTASLGDVETASLAMPTDALQGAPPAQLVTLSTAVREAFDAVGTNDWAGASAAGAAVTRAWTAYQSQVPEMLRKQMGRDVDSLVATVAARTPAQAHAAALRVAQNDLDLQMRYQPVVKTDFARMDLWARQLVIDVATGDAKLVAGTVTTLAWIWDRVDHTIDKAAAARVAAALATLKPAADRFDVAAVGAAAPALQAALGAATPRA